MKDTANERDLGKEELRNGFDLYLDMMLSKPGAQHSRLHSRYYDFLCNNFYDVDMVDSIYDIVYDAQELRAKANMLDFFDLVDYDMIYNVAEALNFNLIV